MANPAMLPTGIKSTLYIDHVVLTVSSIAQTSVFYRKILGEPEYQDEYVLMYRLGETKLFLTLPYGSPPANDRFDANRIGLEHLAIGVRTPQDLKEIETTLNRNAIRHSGIHIDKHSNKEKIWLDDPDGIRLEFFIRP